MKLITKKELVDYMWNSTKGEDGTIEWANEKWLSGYTLRSKSEHKNVACIGMLMSLINGYLARNNSVRTINIAEFINKREIPKKLAGSEVEPYFVEIFERLDNVSNP